MNKDLRKDDSVASSSGGFASLDTRLVECYAKKACSRTVVMNIAHVDPGIVVDYRVAEILASRLSSHVGGCDTVIAIVYERWCTIC